MRYLLSSLDVLSEELEASHPAVSALLDEAGSFLQASDVRVAADVAVLADQLRALLPALDVEESVQVANGLIDQYGAWPQRGEHEALPVPLLPSPTHRSGPNPATTTQYQPGQEQWWAKLAGSALTDVSSEDPSGYWEITYHESPTETSDETHWVKADSNDAAVQVFNDRFGHEGQQIVKVESLSRFSLFYTLTPLVDITDDLPELLAEAAQLVQKATAKEPDHE